MLKNVSSLHPHRLHPKALIIKQNRFLFLAILCLILLRHEGSAFFFNNKLEFRCFRAPTIRWMRGSSSNKRPFLGSSFSKRSSFLSSYVVDQGEQVNSKNTNANDTGVGVLDWKQFEQLQSFTTHSGGYGDIPILEEEERPPEVANETEIQPFFATFVPVKQKRIMGATEESIVSPPPIVFDGSGSTSSDEPKQKRRRSWKRWFLKDVSDEEEGDVAKHRARKLSSLLARTATNSTAGRQYAARTITGLINALAEEVSDLDVQVNVDENTPLHEKHIHSVKIEFSTLGFKPLWMGGHHSVARLAENCNETVGPGVDPEILGSIMGDLGTNETITVTADEAFDQMDADKSGFIDYDELLQTLSLIASRSAGVNSTTTDRRQILPILKNLASDLFRLYDKNGDGVVDRKEYKRMVDDMAALSRESDSTEEKSSKDFQALIEDESPHRKLLIPVKRFFDRIRRRKVGGTSGGQLNHPAANRRSNENNGEARMKRADAVDISQLEGSSEPVVCSPELVESVQKSIGSIVFSNVKMDLRRLVFGAIPVLKRVLPGGPLILEPFTTTVTGSFNRDDIMKSVLLDAALRRLVMRTLRKRVGFVRDFMEGSVFRGRSWKTFGGEGGPQVEVPRLTNVEFDQTDKMIVTGRAKIKAHPDSPVIEQAFKLRTRLGTRKEGRFVRLEEPELALVLECPKSWDNAISQFCSAFGLHKPSRPQPIYSFFPIYSPFKLQDDDGFDLGADNAIKSLYIKDGALRFEMSAILRPGRFLGSHYIAFSTPIRTVIVTLDRVAEGMRAARRVKKAQNNGVKRSKRFLFLGRIEDAIMNRQDRRLQSSSKPNAKGFLSRFLDGYRSADTGEADKERVTKAIREFFGKQSR